MESISAGTLLEYQFVSAPAFSPDGKKIAFVVQKADLESNDYKGDLYLYDCAAGSVLRLTYSGDVKKFIWTKAGTILFQASRGEGDRGEKGKPVSCFYELRIDGGEAGRKFSLPVHATSIRDCGDGRFLVEAVTEPPSRDDAYEIFDEVPFWSNGKGITNQKRALLYVYEAGTDSLIPVCDGRTDCSSYSVRGSRVLYKVYPWNDVRKLYDGVYLYDMDTKENRCLLEKDVRRTGSIAFWDDGLALIAAAEDSDFGEEEYLDFYTMDLGDGSMKPLTPYDHSIASGSVGTDARLGGGRTDKNAEDGYYFISTKGDSALLYRISRDGVISEALTPEGSCDSFDVFEGHVVVCGLYGNRLPELYLDGRRITDFNRTEERWEISVPESFCFTDGDGFQIRGWVMKPAGYRAGQSYPAILNIHGGPRTVFGSVFHHEMQTWAAAGYFVFYCNPRGSDGGGTAFGSLNGKYGTVDFDDLMQFTDEVLKRYPDIDASRLGVTGGSYGGFMTNWIIGHTDRFRAAASQRSIANWISFEHLSDIGHTFTKYTQSVFTREDANKLWWHSPLKYAANCKTPTLFVHSDEDYRCPLAEGLQMFSALKVLGVESRLCLIRGENHELSRSGRPRNRILRMKEILNWMDGHLKDEAPQAGTVQAEGSGQ